MILLFRSSRSDTLINFMDVTYFMATTISISPELKEKIRNLGRAGDTYEDVIGRMYEFTKKNLLLEYLYDESDSLTLEEARRRLNG